MYNTLLTLAFVGTRYHGFQVQQNALAICTVLQDAIEKVVHARPDVKGCSRTDAGVHARQYCVSFFEPIGMPPQKLPLALNYHLPPDIRVLDARRVPADFHARYAASGKEYQYVFFCSAVDDPFALGLYHRVPWQLDAQAMHRAGQALVGRHDFAAFMSAGGDVADTVRTVAALQVQRQASRVVMTVAADGFLYHMVRILAGTLLRVGNGKAGEEMPAAVLAARQRGAAGETMPACGLFLTQVFYPPAAFADGTLPQG